MYADAGVDLAAEPVVGIGSVCRRQGTGEIAAVVAAMAARRIRLHGFGVKKLGLAAVADLLASADSMAWSTRGRHVAGCSPTHKTEANCMRFALAWRRELLDGAANGQPLLF